MFAPGTRRSPAEEPAYAIDHARLRQARLGRLRGEMGALGIDALILVDPISIRYASGARNMQVFMLRNPARYLFVPLEGPVILFDLEDCHHLARGLETIDEIRPAVTVSYPASGPRLDESTERWVAELADLARTYGRGARLGLERVNAAAASALARRGFTLVDAQGAVERARAVKTPDEIGCIRAAVSAVEEAVARLREAIEPGARENEVWARLHERVIAADGEYVETRLLASGPRTNPWFQEAGARPIRAGDLVALDTDVVGRFGYYADFSRTFLCGDMRPTGAQRMLYQLAHEQVHANMELLRPGVSFRELAEKAWPIPDEYLANRYFVLAHGVGMTGEYPYIAHAVDFERYGYDGLIEENMTLCVESYLGTADGAEGVKLEQQVLVTAGGVEVLSTFPFEEALLAP